MRRCSADNCTSSLIHGANSPSLGVHQLDNRLGHASPSSVPYHPYQIPATWYCTWATFFNTSTPVSDTSLRTTRTTTATRHIHPFPQCRPGAPVVCSQQSVVHMTAGCASCAECSPRWDLEHQHYAP